MIPDKHRLQNLQAFGKEALCSGIATHCHWQEGQMAPERSVVKVYKEENILVSFIESNPSCKLATVFNRAALQSA